ncbi:sugar transferase [Nocardioides sp. 616]|uniref:sugar transferase n=1 Tax=Nocardioides sp. 616 TaxID=2268090 RepID=UPI001963300D|nr:sugar transferase [Nocardioides sp. 616]
MTQLSQAPEASGIAARRHFVLNDSATEIPGLRRTQQLGQDWRTRYARILFVGDFLVLMVALGAAQVVRFGVSPEPRVDGPHISYLALGAILVGVWWTSLQIHQTRKLRVVGHGAEEYRRVVASSCRAFAVLAVLGVALEINASRLYLVIAFALGLLLLLLERKVARVWLSRARSRGRAMTKVLVIGGERSAGQVARWFSTHVDAGYRVSGVWIPDGAMPEADRLDTGPSEVPVMSSLVEFADALSVSGARAVVVTDTEHLGHESLQDLTWRLEGTGIDLLLSPNVLDVASSRLTLDDVSGMPLLHLSEPQYSGAGRLGKTLFDRIGACLLIVVLGPLLIATALAVKLTSVGPVFYRQERVGQGGQAFGMMKFRSMRVGADAELESLLAAEGKSLAELPKLTRDPRVTRVGAFIRRFSIDEVPQLFNVLKGDMSLVGPRPQRDFEVEQYDHVATRRLTVRPGMTGLWQVSGRSDLSYDEAIRLDVHYVENWSITSDLMILWRTVRAVVASDGAY